jgi:hypothetical protein
VAVLLRVYANCVDGEESIFNERIETALGPAGLHGTLDTATDQVRTETEEFDHGTD